jgi:hypothetical protein
LLITRPVAGYSPVISTDWGEAMTGIVVSAVLLIGGAMLILLLAMRS